MSYVAKDKDVDAAGPAFHKIRITLTSRNVKNLEKGEHPFSISLEVQKAVRYRTRTSFLPLSGL